MRSEDGLYRDRYICRDARGYFRVRIPNRPDLNTGFPWRKYDGEASALAAARDYVAVKVAKHRLPWNEHHRWAWVARGDSLRPGLVVRLGAPPQDGLSRGASFVEAPDAR